jgi:hypothetical protein
MSRATMIDAQPEQDNVQNPNEEVVELLEEPEDIGEQEAQSDNPPVQETTQAETRPHYEPLPQKYRGKKVRELVEMHQEAEKLLGRQSSEVGELRKVVDDFIQNQTQQKAPQQSVEPDDDIDYFTDPRTAVNRAIENHPKIREATQYSEEYKKQSALATLQTKHPDMKEILDDPKFGEWVNASKIRARLFAEAHQQYDAEAADELFSLWKERKTVARQTANVERLARKQQVRAANTGNARGSAAGSRKKVYRRADIIKLMKTDPERYQALSPEILQAYAEGRVK